MTKEEYTLAVGQLFKEVGEERNFNYLPVADEFSLPKGKDLSSIMLAASINSYLGLRFSNRTSKNPAAPAKPNVKMPPLHSVFYEYDLDSKKHYEEALDPTFDRKDIELSQASMLVADSSTSATAISRDDNGSITNKAIVDSEIANDGSLIVKNEETSPIARELKTALNNLEYSYKTSNVLSKKSITRDPVTKKFNIKDDLLENKFYGQFFKQLKSLDDTNGRAKAIGNLLARKNNDGVDIKEFLNELNDRLGIGYLIDIAKGAGQFVSEIVGVNLPGLGLPNQKMKARSVSVYSHYGWVDSFGVSKNTLQNQEAYTIGTNNPTIEGADIGADGQKVINNKDSKWPYSDQYGVPWAYDDKGNINPFSYGPKLNLQWSEATSASARVGIWSTKVLTKEAGDAHSRISAPKGGQESYFDTTTFSVAGDKDKNSSDTRLGLAGEGAIAYMAILRQYWLSTDTFSYKDKVNYDFAYQYRNVLSINRKNIRNGGDIEDNKKDIDVIKPFMDGIFNEYKPKDGQYLPEPAYYKSIFVDAYGRFRSYTKLKVNEKTSNLEETDFDLVTHKYYVEFSSKKTTGALATKGDIFNAASSHQSKGILRFGEGDLTTGTSKASIEFTKTGVPISRQVEGSESTDKSSYTSKELIDKAGKFAKNELGFRQSEYFFAREEGEETERSKNVSLKDPTEAKAADTTARDLLYSNPDLDGKMDLLKWLVTDSTDMFKNNFVCWLSDEDGNIVNPFDSKSKNAYEFIFSTLGVDVPMAQKHTVSFNYFGRQINKVMECSSKAVHTSTISMKSDQALKLYNWVAASIGVKGVDPAKEKKAFKYKDSKLNLNVALWTGKKIKDKIKNGKEKTFNTLGKDKYIPNGDDERKFVNPSAWSDQNFTKVPVITFYNIRFMNLPSIKADPTNQSRVDHQLKFAFETHEIKKIDLNNVGEPVGSPVVA